MFAFKINKATICDNWTGNSVSKVEVYFHAKSTDLWLAASTIVC